MSQRIPEGIVTFLFTDIEGSTVLARRLGTSFTGLIAEHFALIREVIGPRGGVEVKTIGDGHFSVFTEANDAVLAAIDIQQGMAAHHWPAHGAVRVRIGAHTGAAEVVDNDYVGIEVHRASRIAAAGHGGQILVSETTYRQSLVAYRALGKHLLKGLEVPEPLYQVLVPGQPSEFPPLRTLSGHPNNLPVLGNAILGREKEIATVLGLVADNRLVTLLGPGGVGKSRLAIAVGAEALPRFESGVTFVDLSAVSDPDLVLPTLATEVGADDSTLEGIASHLQGKQQLLVLDNFEQVLSAAPQLDRLASMADSVKLLVTSQAALRIRGERRFPVRPLGRNGGAPGDTSGVRLFIERAHAVAPDFEAEPNRIADLVDLLDGLPLAIELAAARANLMSVDQMIERFERGQTPSAKIAGVPSRHQSLEHALTWSYGLLDRESQAVFRRLGMFAGGMTLEATESIADGEPVGDVLEELSELLDRSLVTRDGGSEGRLHMLESIRRFALQKLAESGETTGVKERFLDWYCGIGAEAYAGLQSENGEWWRTRLDAEHDNIRAALGELAANGRTDEGLLLLGNTWRYYQSRGKLSELELWLDRFFAMADIASATPGVVKGLMARGALHYWRFDMDGAISSYEKATRLARTLDNTILVADALYGLVTSLLLAKRRSEAEPHLVEVREIYEQAGDKGGVADILATDAFAAIPERGIGALKAEFTQVRELYAAAGRTVNAVQTLYALFGVELANQRHEEARRLATEGIRQARTLNDLYLSVWGIEFQAIVEAADGHWELAGALIGAGETARESIGGGWSSSVLGLEDAPSRLIAGVGPDNAEELIAAGRKLRLDEAVALALGEQS